jgi:hypothetical protein
VSGLPRRRRIWRWAVAVWAVAVVAGGLLTLWLRDSAEPPPPVGRQESSPTPSLPEGWETRCPRPTAGTDDGPAAILCAFSTIR